MDPLSWLPQQTISRINAAVNALKDTLGKRARAIVLTGAALNPARHDRGQAPELLVITKGIDLDELRAIAKGLGDAMNSGVRVKILTQDELKNSADVFALEVADYRDRHVLLHGKDPFGEVVVEDADLRRSIEQSIRGLSRRMRNRVLAGVATRGKRGDAQLAVAQGIDRLVVLAHHAIQLSGEDPPRKENKLLAKLCELADVSPEAILSRLEQLRTGHTLGDPIDALGNVMDVCVAVKRWVDKLEVAD